MGALSISGQMGVGLGPRHTGGGTPTPTPSPTPQVLTQTSGSGVNPPTWSEDFTLSTAVVGDYDILQWRVNGGAWNRDTDHLLTSDDFFDMVDGTAVFVWPLFAAATFASSAFVEWQGGIRVGGVDYWGSILSDTMAASVGFTHKRSAETAISFGVGTGAVTGGTLTFAAGDKVVLHLSTLSTTHPGTVTGITANGGALTFTKIGESDATYYRKSSAWRLDLPGGTTALTDVTIAVSASAAFNIIAHVFAISGAPAGAPAASYFEKRLSAASGAQDVDGGLAAVTNGHLLASVGNFGAASGGWAGATQAGEVVSGTASTASAIADQTAAADIIYTNSVTADLSIAVTKWSP